MTYRISGLIYEDGVRSSLMFLNGTTALHPTSPIDMSAQADRIQGIPTHVKLKLKKKDKNGKPIDFKLTFDANGVPNFRDYSIDMACAFQFWCLVGDHRLVIGFYHNETFVDEHGEKHNLIVVTQTLEIIITQHTLNLFRGKIPLSEIEWIKATVQAWKPKPKNQAEADAANEWKKKNLHVLTDKMRKEGRVGIASPSIHVDDVDPTKKMMNNRIQSSISLLETVKAVMTEDIGYGPGKYRNPNHPGSQVQDRVILYNEQRPFYGMNFPWKTRASVTKPVDGWKLKRVNVPKKKEVSVCVPEGEFAGCALNLIETEERKIADGKLIFRTYDDKWRILELRANDEEVKDNFFWACRMIGSMRLGESLTCLATEKQSERIYESLKAHGLPASPERGYLKPIQKYPGLYRINTSNGHYLAKHLQSGDWVIKHGAYSDKPEHKVILEKRASCAFRAFGQRTILRRTQYLGDDNWIIPKDDMALVEDAATALIGFTFLDR